MKYEFHWLTGVSDSKKAATEAAIREGQESGDSPISFCHDGPAIVTLSVPDALQKRFIGGIECSCGKPCGRLKGKCNGSSVSFDAVSG